MSRRALSSAAVFLAGLLVGLALVAGASALSSALAPDVRVTAGPARS